MNQENITKSGIGDFSFTSTITDTFTYDLFNDSKVTIDSFEFKQTSDGNFIEVIKRQMPNPYSQISIYPPRPDVPRVWKEIYGVISDDSGARNLQLIRTIEGKVSLGHYVDEDVSFEE